MDHGSVTIRGCIKFGVGRGSLNSIMGNGLWVSQVRRGFDGFVGLSSPSWLSQFRWHWLGFELVWIVAGLGGSGVEDRGGSACRPRLWRGGDQLFFFFFGDYVVAISCGCDCCWWFLEA